MFKVKPMRPQDFAFATELANTMDWKMAPQDFQYATTLEPDGSFALTDDAQRIGIATSIAYGKVGWFGNLIIKPEHRGRGAGSFLVRHAIDFLHGRGVETIGLYAYPNLIRFYRNLGFKVDDEFAVLHAKAMTIPTQEMLPQIKKQDIDRIAQFDSECFGGDRRKLLESIILDEDNLSFFLSEHGRIVGYVTAKIYGNMAEVGPLVCQSDRSDAAVALVRAVLGKLGNCGVYVWGLPKKEASLAHALLRFGFREEFSVTRMFLGEPTAQNCIYIAESLERG